MYICYKRMSRISYRIQAGHPKMSSHTGESENPELVDLQGWLPQQYQPRTVGWRILGALLVFSAHWMAEGML